MLQRVMMDGINLPRLYIAENKADADLAKSKGIPFIRWTEGQEALIKMLLRPVLEQMFPFIKWSSVLGRRRKFKTMVEIDRQEELDVIGDDGIIEELDENTDCEEDEQEDIELEDTMEDIELEGTVEEDEDGTIIEHASIADKERQFLTHKSSHVTVERLSIEEYVGDMSSYVNLDVLQRLRLMPAFIGDILECVRINVSSGMYWSEGYNKKRGLPVGRYNSSGQMPNLIILDVSGSIPRGISATMISLIDTLRTQLSADLIITSSRSRFYPMGSTLPNPQTIRNQFGYGNESHDFFYILTKHIRGRHYGHVFSFGDNDTPAYICFKEHPEQYSLEGTVVEHVHHYHTGQWIEYNRDYGNGGKTGYAKWCHMLSKPPLEDYDTSWCKVIIKDEDKD